MKSIVKNSGFDRMRARESVVTTPTALTTARLLAKGSVMAASQPNLRTDAPQVRPCNLKWTRDTIAEELRSKADINGVTRIGNVSRYLQIIIYHHFANFYEACEYAGVRPGKLKDGATNARVCAVAECDDITRSSGCKYCEKHYMRMRRKGRLNREMEPKVVNHHAFDELTDANAWLMGLIWTDGCISRNHLLVTSKDREVLVQAEKVIGGRDLIRSRKGGKYFNLSIASKRLVDSLRSHGLTEAKSLTCRWPVNLPESLDGAFLRGVIDGDGTVPLKEHYAAGGEYLPRLQVSIYTGSAGFARDIEEVFNRRGIKTSTHRKPSKNCTIAKIAVCNIESLRKLFDLLHGSGGPAMHRKKAPFEKWAACSREYQPIGLRGELGNCAKLTQAQVAAIRERYSQRPKITMEELGRQYGVHAGTIQSIVRYRTWRHQ